MNAADKRDMREGLVAIVAYAIGLTVLAVLPFQLAGCSTPKPQRGGVSQTTLGGATAPTTINHAAPENPQTPSTTTVEKTVTREFAPQNLSEPLAASSTPVSGPISAKPDVPAAPSKSLAPIVREVVTERATTQLGTAQKDTARELGARLANMRGVLWVGVALLIGGPLVGWKLGWFTNGCIAGAVGLLLIILSTVIPGNEAWFGLGGLLLIPLVAFVYYRARHDAGNSAAS